MATVLCLDDEESILELYRFALPRMGYEVITKRDPDSAGEELRSKDLAGIVTDNDMKAGTNGIELIEQIRSGVYGQRNKDVPIILHTGDNDNLIDLIERVNELGAAYLAKPSMPKDLKAMINDLFVKSNETSSG